MKKEGILHHLKEFYPVLSAKISKGEITVSSIVIAYYILFSIFPIIIIVGNILPLFSIDINPIADYIRMVFPDRVAEFIMPIVKSLLKSNSTGYISFGIIFAIWSFSSLVNAIRIGMNRIYGVHKTELKQNFLMAIWTRGFSVFLTTLMIVIFTAAALIFIWGQYILENLKPYLAFSVQEIQKILSYRYPVVMIIMILAVWYLNFALPNIRLKKRVIWPGVLTTVAGWSILSYLFGFYLNNFKISWENYGIVGTFIIFMLYLNLSSLLLLFGTCINATIIQLRVGQVPYSPGRLAEFIYYRRHNKR
ncbi:YihY/virulence factor BrkB family protein [Lactobacillus sp. LL6]|uniref:YihY/virulence factor BrkB family protein n=1 Tax=Lactobacillus sp. LL6 TaxID=2596827 RepID=UPI0011853E03|nr:YihY/virulence factor BrkB family protein [Lactobacillus sp. LL6]TSO25969.1 YihY/virulence factor BrkB family protein [Lactobacillus sp. LL6]